MRRNLCLSVLKENETRKKSKINEKKVKTVNDSGKIWKWCRKYVVLKKNAEIVDFMNLYKKP